MGKRRVYTYDLLRGLVVFLMILSHSIYFFHNRDSAFLVRLEGIGNAVCFVTFLLVSGAVSYVAYLKHYPGEWTDRRRKITGRFGVLLLSYYLLALLLSSVSINQAVGLEKWRLVYNIFTFREMPGFTQYFPAFIVYAILLAFLPQLFTWMIQTPVLLVISMVTTYSLGYALLRLPVPEYVTPWKTFLAGGDGVYRFPIFQYAPVYLLGLYWGKLTAGALEYRKKREIVGRFFVPFLMLTTISLLVYFCTPLKHLFWRWPPTPSFIFLGLMFAFGVSYLFYFLYHLRRVPLLRDFLLLFGQNAFALFWSHVMILGLYEMAGGAKVSSVSLFFVLFIILILLSFILAIIMPFNYRFALTFIRRSEEDEREQILAHDSVLTFEEEIARDFIWDIRQVRKYFFPRPGTESRRVMVRRRWLAYGLLGLVAAMVIAPSVTEEVQMQLEPAMSSVWWSEDFAYRMNLTVKNEASFDTVKPGELASITINHEKLVQEKKSKLDGSDIALVYWDGVSYQAIESLLTNPGQKNATLQFLMPTTIGVGRESHTFALYYGNFTATNRQTFSGTPAVLKPSLGEEERFKVFAAVSKRWNLIQENTENIILTVKSSAAYTRPSVSYTIAGSSITGTMTAQGDGSWWASVPVKYLQPGAYQFQAQITDGAVVEKSQRCGFFVSYPLYVAWTEDWEGYDVKEHYLQAIADLSTRYGMPITHFFNPRIYVTDTITPERADYLTNWVKDRIFQGDDIGLHIHMFDDFVRSAGLEPKTEPNWGDNGDGYGVPGSAYSKEELITIIGYGSKLMTERGFLAPNKYRAGGWFANGDTLAALEELGIKIDSSGRTSYSFGRNKLAGYWDLQPTTKPFYPSLDEQNKESSDSSGVFEIPNNGADSYWFGADDLINRFKANFHGTFLSQKQQITYLSHPHWFKQEEQAKIDSLYSYMKQYLATNDSGPVVYATTEEIYNAWHE